MPQKALAALSGTGLSGSLVTIILAFTGVPTKGGIPPEIFAAALVTGVNAPIAYAATYLTRYEGAKP